MNTSEKWERVTGGAASGARTTVEQYNYFFIPPRVNQMNLSFIWDLNQMGVPSHFIKLT